MNILLLSQFFSSTKGGGEYVFNLMAETLSKKDHKVWVLTNKIQDETYSNYDNVIIEFVPPNLKYQGGLPPTFSENIKYVWGSFWKGLSIIKKEKIDIIHSNNFSPALAGSLLSTFTKKPHITTVHDIFSLCGEDYWKRWGDQNNVSSVNVRFGKFFEKMMSRHGHTAIHTVSNATKEDLTKFGAKKPIYVIPNAIQTKNHQKQKTIPHQLIYIGRLVFYKNLEIVIKAISIVRKSHPDVKLIIVGDGPHRKNLELIVKKLELANSIKFEGHVSQERKEALLASSCALVFPSLCEGFGLVILEAFNQFKTVLVSNIRPLSDIVSNEKNGFVLPPDDEKKWAIAIEHILENNDVAEQMGKVGNELVQKVYNVDVMYEKIEKMYSDFIH